MKLSDAVTNIILLPVALVGLALQSRYRRKLTEATMDRATANNLIEDIEYLCGVTPCDDFHVGDSGLDYYNMDGQLPNGRGSLSMHAHLSREDEPYYLHLRLHVADNVTISIRKSGKTLANAYSDLMYYLNETGNMVCCVLDEMKWEI